MARPKKDANQKPAIERIEDAFWSFLEKGQYNEITVSSLSRSAGVNHNTFYYHFENLEDLSYRMFRRNVPEEFFGAAYTALVHGEFPFKELIKNGEFTFRFHRMQLLARTNSLFIKKMLKEGLLETWLMMSKKSKEDFSKEELIQLGFLVNGIVGLLGEFDYELDSQDLVRFFTSSLGGACAQTLRDVFIE